MKRRIAFVCDTPYQLFVIISLIFCNKDIWSHEKDLYIDIKRSKKAKMYAYYKKIADMDLFSNVYILNSLSSTYRKLNMVEWLFPQNSIRYGMNQKKALNNKYTEVYISGPFMLQRNFIYYYKPQYVYFFEDGTGSYNDRIGLDLLNIKGKIMQFLLKRGPRYIYPKNLYLFSPQIYRGEYANIVKKIEFPKEKLDVFKSVFMYELNPAYLKRKLIYLSQPMHPFCITTEDAILEILDNFSNHLIIRPHPQDYNKFGNNSNVDTCQDLWELVCINCISEDHVLIGKYSTAQITPKLIFNKEPYIVFTYYLFEDKSQKVETGIHTIESLYKNKNKIFVPKTKEEFKQIIYAILVGKLNT